MIREGSIQELTQQRGMFIVGLAPGQTMPQDDLYKAGYHVRPAAERWEVALTEAQSIDAVVDILRARGLSVHHLVEKKQSLEELFLATVEAAEPGVDGPAHPHGDADRVRAARRDEIRGGMPS
jgi:ABC-2 type transport system ATP-binding protein